MRCFEIAVDRMTISEGALKNNNTMLTLFDLNAKFHNFEWINLCKNLNLQQISGGEEISICAGKSCFFIMSDEELEKLRHSEHLLLRFCTSGSQDTIFGCKLSLKTDSKGWATIYSKSGDIFGQIFLLFSISDTENMLSNAKNSGGDTSVKSFHESPVTKSSGIQTGKINRKSNRTQTILPNFKTKSQQTKAISVSRKIQTLEKRKNTRSTSPLPSPLSIQKLNLTGTASTESDKIIENNQKSSAENLDQSAQNLLNNIANLSIFSEFLKRFLTTADSEKFPLITELTQELENVSNFSSNRPPTSKNNKEFHDQRKNMMRTSDFYGLGDSRYGYNIFSRMQAAKSLPYNLNKTAVQRMLYKPFYVPKNPENFILPRSKSTNIAQQQMKMHHERNAGNKFDLPSKNAAEQDSYR